MLHNMVTMEIANSESLRNLRRRNRENARYETDHMILIMIMMMSARWRRMMLVMLVRTPTGTWVLTAGTPMGVRLTLKGRRERRGAGHKEVRLLTVARTWSAGRLEVKEVARRVLPYTLTASGQQLWMSSAQEMRTMSPAHRSGNPVQVVVEEYQVTPAVMKGRHIRRSVRAWLINGRRGAALVTWTSLGMDCRLKARTLSLGAGVEEPLSVMRKATMSRTLQRRVWVVPALMEQAGGCLKEEVVAQVGMVVLMDQAMGHLKEEGREGHNQTRIEIEDVTMSGRRW
jgi:hypothetical protein